METKRCYSCCEEIKAEAKQCPHCQSYQSPIARIIKSNAGGAILGIAAVWIFFAWLIGNQFGNNAIYDPKGVFTISDTSIQFKDTSCGKQVVVLGKISNNGEQVLTDIVFDVEFYNESGKLIDSVSDTKYDLVIPPGSTKSFKIKGGSGANEEQYTTHKVVVAKAEPDKW